MKPASMVLAWDLFTRLLHWLLAALVVVNLVPDYGDYAHRMLGYAAVAVVALRLAWGLFSHSHANLAELKPSISRSLRYAAQLRAGQKPYFVGHNPLGTWMVWIVWLLVILLGLSGWMTRWDVFWGDERLHDVHAHLADALLGAVLLHLVAVSVMSWWLKEDLPQAMITGLKRAQ
jgi:cytochrome b